MTMNFSEDPNNYFIKTFSNLVKIKKPASTDNQQKHVTLFTYPVEGEWEAGPMYKSKGCTIVFPRKYSALNTDLELKLLLFLDHACLL